MSYAKLRGKIREVYGTQDAFSEAMGVSSVTISQRLNGKTDWKTNEIAKACELLGIPLKDVALYFFTPEIKFS